MAWLFKFRLKLPAHTVAEQLPHRAVLVEVTDHRTLGSVEHEAPPAAQEARLDGRRRRDRDRVGVAGQERRHSPGENNRAGGFAECTLIYWTGH